MSGQGVSQGPSTMCSGRSGCSLAATFGGLVCDSGCFNAVAAVVVLVAPPSQVASPCTTLGTDVGVRCAAGSSKLLCRCCSVRGRQRSVYFLCVLRRAGCRQLPVMVGCGWCNCCQCQRFCRGLWIQHPSLCLTWIQGETLGRFRIGVPMPTCCDIEQVKNLAAPSSDEGCHPPARLDIPLLLLCC